MKNYNIKIKQQKNNFRLLFKKKKELDVMTQVNEK